MLYNRKKFSIDFFIISLLFHNLSPCMTPNTVPIALKNSGVVIEKKPKVLWFLAASTLCITALFFIKYKNKISNKINNNTKDRSNVNQNVSFVNGVAIVDYDINNHKQEVEKIAGQDPDNLDDTKESSKDKKIADIMNDLKTLDTTKILIKEDGRLPIGFINYRLKCETIGYILLLAIDNQHHRKGYGTLLLNHAMSELKAQKATSITIDVLKTNIPAKKAYEKLHFVFDELNPIREGVIKGTLQCIGT